MMTWCMTRERNILGNRFVSSAERRLVFFRGGSVTVLPPGTHRVPVFQGITSVGLVHMLARPVSRLITSGLRSGDGIAFAADVVATLRVRDDPSAIRRVALAEADEETLALLRVTKAMETACAKRRWAQVKNDTSLSGETLELAKGGDNALEVVDFSCQIRAIDKRLDVVDTETVFGVEHAKQLQREAQGKIEQARSDAERRHVEHQAELERVKAGRLQEVELRQREDEQRINTAANLLKVLADPNGMWAVHPESAEKIALAKAQAEASVAAALLRYQAGVDRGQLDVAMRLMEKHLGGTVVIETKPIASTESAKENEDDQA